jgi:hypothetical protein
MSALVLLGLLLLLTFFSEANAFTITDRATCKYVDPKTHDCKERTNQFDLADEWAFFWFRGTMETSDAGAKEAKFNLYDPDGQQFLGAPFIIPFAFPISAPKPGENVVGWIGIGISKANVAVGLMPGISITGTITAINGRPVGPASEKPGEWQVEFTLDSKVVVSERFTIGKAPITQLYVPGLPSNLFLIAAVAAVLLVIVGVTLFALRRRRPTKT